MAAAKTKKYQWVKRLIKERKTSRKILQMASDAGTDLVVWTQRICLHDDFSGNVSQIYGNHGTE